MVDLPLDADATAKHATESPAAGAAMTDQGVAAAETSEVWRGTIRGDGGRMEGGRHSGSGTQWRTMRRRAWLLVHLERPVRDV